MTAAGNYWPGHPVLHPVFERAVLSKEGIELFIRSTRAPGEHGEPGPEFGEGPGLMPLIIGTVMSALFSGYMAFT